MAPKHEGPDSLAHRSTDRSGTGRPRHVAGTIDDDRANVPRRLGGSGRTVDDNGAHACSNIEVGFAPASLAVRHAMENLIRPGNQATSIMVAIGIGVMVILYDFAFGTIARAANRREPSIQCADFFFIDLQPDQQESFERLIQQRFPGNQPELTPLYPLAASLGEWANVSLNEEEDRERSRGASRRARKARGTSLENMC